MSADDGDRQIRHDVRHALRAAGVDRREERRLSVEPVDAHAEAVRPRNGVDAVLKNLLQLHLELSYFRPVELQHRVRRLALEDAHICIDGAHGLWKQLAAESMCPVGPKHPLRVADALDRHRRALLRIDRAEVHGREHIMVFVFAERLAIVATH